MVSKLEILQKRLGKLDRHYSALKEYHALIFELEEQRNIYTPDGFRAMSSRERAILGAYLRRFS